MSTGWNPFSRLWGQQRRGSIPPALSSALSETNPQHQAFLRSMAKDVQRSAANDPLPLADLEAIVVDLETTGFLASRGDEIIAIGATVVRGTTVCETEQFYTLVNPKRDIPEHIQRLTGITCEQLQTAPPLLNAISQFFQFVGDRPLIAHHSLHERQFLQAALWKTSRTRLAHRLIDTLVLIRLCEQPLGDTSLDALCARNQIPLLHRHHAYWDAVACAHLWTTYLQRVLALGYRDLREVYREYR